MPSFVDTNILVYAEDRDAGNKHTIARDLVANLWRSEQGCDRLWTEDLNHGQRIGDLLVVNPFLA